MYSKLSSDNKYVIVKMQGDINLGSNRDILDKTFLEALSYRTPHVILDLEDVRDIDSSIIGKLLSFYKESQMVNSHLGLLGVNETIKEKLNALLFFNFIKCYNSESDITI